MRVNQREPLLLLTILATTLGFPKAWTACRGWVGRWAVRRSTESTLPLKLANMTCPWCSATHSLYYPADLPPSETCWDCPNCHYPMKVTATSNGGDYANGT